MAVSERFSSLPDNSLSIIGTTNRRLSDAYELGHFDFGKVGGTEFLQAKYTSIYRLVNNQYPESDIMTVHTVARNLATMNAYNPFLILTLSPQVKRDYVGRSITLPISMDRVIFSLDVSDMPLKVVIKETVNLMEDNVGKIEMMIKRFGVPQQPRQA